MSVPSRLFLCITALLSLTLPSRAAAAPGDLDTSFNGQGWLSLAGSPAGNMVKQGDGKLLLMNDGGIRRISADGSLDLSFGTNGFAAIAPDSGPVWSQDLAVQSDGKILVVVKRWGTANQIFLARFRSDGTSDTRFGDGKGYVITQPDFLNDGGIRIALQQDGKIVIALQPGGIVRYLADGTLDRDFGTGGFATGILPGGVGALAVQKDGKILFAGTVYGIGVGRLNPDGTPDLTFGTDGIFGHFFYNGRLATVTKLVLQADGKILAGGSYEGPPNEPSRGLIARILPSGTLDTSFNGKGWNDYGIPDSRRAETSGLLAQDDGRIILAGTSMVMSTNPNPRVVILPGGASVVITPSVNEVTLVRFLPDGRLDPDFGAGGTVIADFGAPPASCLSAVLLPDGKIFTANRVGSALVLARYESGYRPSVVVNDPGGPRLEAGPDSPVDFGPVTLGSRTKVFTVGNYGTVPLTGLSVSLANESQAQEYISTQPASPLAPGAETTFLVTFTPGGPGIRRATLNLFSSHPAHNPLVIPLTGKLATPLQVWRVTHFGSPENSGTGADLNDFDNDGLPNLLEYATGSHPHRPSPPVGHLVKTGETLDYTYTRPVSALSELNYQTEASTGLAGPWFTDDIATTVTADDGVTQTVRSTTPAAGPVRFLRVRVTRRPDAGE